jgi:hypothetical protein
MKINLRFILAGLILACIAALGVSHGAWAGPLMHGTIPPCKTREGSIRGIGNIILCHAIIVVEQLPKRSSVTATEINLREFELPPGGKYDIGVAVTFGNENHKPDSGYEIDVCFPVPSGVIYRYWTRDELRNYYRDTKRGRWIVSPTVNEAGDPAGFSCTETRLAGIYAIVY